MKILWLDLNSSYAHASLALPALHAQVMHDPSLEWGVVSATINENPGELKNPRILRILSHKEQDSECFSLQWEVEDSAALHRWHVKQGATLNAEMMKVFKDKVIGFPTLMEVIR